MATNITLPTPSAPMSSVSDMLSSVPSTIFDGASDIPSGDESSFVDDAPEPAVSDPEPAAETEIPEEPAKEGIEDEPAADLETAPKDDAKPEATAEELPEGVSKGKDRKGKPGYFLEENRYKTFHGNHQLAQQAAEILGEPLTPEALKTRNDAFLGQERFFSELTSGDPQLQTSVLDFMLDEMSGALEAGETGVDPTIPFAETFYDRIQEKSPDAYAALRLRAARELMGEMFDTAARNSNPHLFGAAQHMVAAITNAGPKPANMSDAQYADHVRAAAERAGLPFHTLQEMQTLVAPEDPASAKDRRIQELESQLHGRTDTSVAAQFTTWNRENVQTVKSSILNDAVTPALASVADGWKDYPDDYRRLVTDPLNKEVMDAVNADPAINRQANELKERAKRATSEQVRRQIGEQIKNLYVHRAQMIADQKKGPIVKFAADWLKARSDNKHERKQSAQTRTAPQGQGAPVKRSLAPEMAGFKDGKYDSSIAMKQMLAVLGR